MIHDDQIPSQTRTTPITADNRPPGCEVLDMRSAAGARARVIGRIVPLPQVDDLPIVAGWGHFEGVGGCEHKPRMIRYPTTGMALPGQESPVGVLLWCEHHGEVGNGMDTATAEERAWGWHAPSRV